MEQIPLPKHVSERVEKRWTSQSGHHGEGLIDETIARLAARRDNVHRYRRLLKRPSCRRSSANSSEGGLAEG